jgi:hypothetical protein
VGRETATKEERDRSLDCWQREREAESRGRWTFRLPDIRPWVERQHGEVGYFLTQFLSGHGYFTAYLHRMGKVASSDCLYCPGTADQAEHIFLSATNGKSAEPPSLRRSAWPSLPTTSLEQCSGERTPGTVCSASLKPFFGWKMSTLIGLNHCLPRRGKP